jgi:aminoglycoside phosphotransferase (APT) family kinase protein
VQADDDRLMRTLSRQPTDAPGMLTRREVVERYCERTHLQVDDWVFYEVIRGYRCFSPPISSSRDPIARVATTPA